MHRAALRALLWAWLLGARAVDALSPGVPEERRSRPEEASAPAPALAADLQGSWLPEDDDCAAQGGAEGGAEVEGCALSALQVRGRRVASQKAKAAEAATAKAKAKATGQAASEGPAAPAPAEGPPPRAARAQQQLLHPSELNTSAGAAASATADVSGMSANSSVLAASAGATSSRGASVQDLANSTDDVARSQGAPSPARSPVTRSPAPHSWKPAASLAVYCLDVVARASGQRTELAALLAVSLVFLLMCVGACLAVSAMRINNTHRARSAATASAEEGPESSGRGFMTTGPRPPPLIAAAHGAAMRQGRRPERPTGPRAKGPSRPSCC